MSKFQKYFLSFSIQLWIVAVGDELNITDGVNNQLKRTKTQIHFGYSWIMFCSIIRFTRSARTAYTVETERTPTTLTNTETYCTSDVNSAPSNSSCWQQNRINQRIGVKQTTVKQPSIDAVCLSDCAIWSSVCFISVCLRRFVVSVYFVVNHTSISTRRGLCWTHFGRVNY